MKNKCYMPVVVLLLALAYPTTEQPDKVNCMAADLDNFTSAKINEEETVYVAGNENAEIIEPEDDTGNEENTSDSSEADVSNEISSIDIDEEIYKAVVKYSAEYEIDEKLILAVIRTESDFNQYALSYADCKGLMQLNDVFFKEEMEEFGITDVYDIDSNIHLGTYYIRDCINKSNGDIKLALMMYNEGYSGALQSFKKSGYSSYVQKVLSNIL